MCLILRNSSTTMPSLVMHSLFEVYSSSESIKNVSGNHFSIGLSSNPSDKTEN